MLHPSLDPHNIHKGPVVAELSSVIVRFGQHVAVDTKSVPRLSRYDHMAWKNQIIHDDYSDNFRRFNIDQLEMHNFEIQME